MEFISIIVPVYNASKFIKDTIKTVLDQTIGNFELILVDDMSTDNSVEIIKSYKDERIKLIELDKKGMASGARNAGIKAAKGNYICFLDADDLWVNDKLEKQLLFMHNNPSCVFLYTSYEFASEDGIGTNKKVIVPNYITYEQALRNTTIFTSTVMFNMNILTKDEIYMPDIKSEDTACWWKVLKNNDAYGIREVLVYYRRTANTLSSNKLEAIKRIWNLYRNQEHLSIIYSIYNFIGYAFNAVKRRI